MLSQDAELFYDEQMTGFIQFLNASAFNYDLKTFEGNSALTGTANHFLYDILEDILIFHSEQFGE
jgi:hypothetical protein